MARGELFLALLCVAAASALAANAADARKTVGVYELRKGDFSVKVTNWGATIMSVILPDSRGNLADVVLGLDTIAEYVLGPPLPQGSKAWLCAANESTAARTSAASGLPGLPRGKDKV
ncbi:aldose 1-epimerase-like [Panicum miliaceum]|uniref:Aldose 1-epimerase-like n=1 Tax=Panicum miliaceum TaxID=4540 RepID=A0A3L6QAI1_PANMI|nr:aldose 1-epimerase-like [Panicum miliaceum]